MVAAFSFDTSLTGRLTGPRDKRLPNDKLQGLQARGFVALDRCVRSEGPPPTSRCECTSLQI